MMCFQLFTFRDLAKEDSLLLSPPVPVERLISDAEEENLSFIIHFFLFFSHYAKKGERARE